ncbi:MAG: ABC transporter ATP-binding protein [Hyphomicrobium sp.]|nr:ABC transporter ATP-binding protein [Hyphomicrobium sp.]
MTPSPSPDVPRSGKSGRPRRIPFDNRARGLLWRFLSDWVFPRWRQLLGATVLMAALAIATGGYPIIIKHAFDILLKGEVGYLPYVLAGIVLITLVRSTFLYLAAVETQRIVLALTTDMQKRVFGTLMASDYAHIVRDAPGHLMSKLTNDVTFIQQATLATVNTIVRDALMVVALVGAMIYLDWVMALVVLGIYPFAALPIMHIARRLRANAKKTQSELGALTQQLGEKFGGARLIKTYQLERYAGEKVDKSFNQVLKLRLRAVSNKMRLEALLEVLAGLAVAGVVWLAYWRISNGVSTVGDFMGFTTALLMSAQPIRSVGQLVARVQEGLAGLDSIYAVLDERSTIIDRPGAKDIKVTRGSIDFDRVSFHYEKSAAVPAVEDFALKVPGGTTVALVGRSGAGKSTIVNLVPRLFDVTSGAIRIDGQDIRDVTVASLRQSISIVSQDVTLFDDTIRANIRLGRLDATDAEIEAAAISAAAHEFITAQPQGYETVIGDRGFRLSGGQRQRIALARAILRNAPILLLDEATSALDTESEEFVQKALAEFTRNRTTLVIAHRLSTVENADLICVMEGGTAVELGTHTELVAKGGIYTRLARAQLLEGVVAETEEIGPLVEDELIPD